ncbi:MAG: hypothetical protein KDA78_15360, partial [Planctomycetaceae bacterium]|nr:hypothetical protein [Planctomycetaceae bacterium]
LRTEQVPSHARKPGERSFQQQSQNPIPVQKGELLGVVVPSGPLELLIEIPPSSQTFVKTGLSISCFPPELGGWSLEAIIAELAPAPVNLVQAGKTSLEYRQLSSLQKSFSPNPQRALIALGVLSSQEMPPLTAYQICPVSIAAEPLSLAGRVMHFWQTQFSGNSLSATP